MQIHYKAMTKEAASKKPNEDEEIALATPLCIRFHPEDMTRIQGLAARDGLGQSVWIREVALARAYLLVEGEPVEPLNVTPPRIKGPGVQVCIRFRPDDWRLIRKASHQEQVLPSSWIRAAVMQKVTQRLGVAKRNEENGERGDRADEKTQREHVKDGVTHRVPVVGKSNRGSSKRVR